MIDLIPEYLESRRAVSKRLTFIQQKQKLAHQSLERLNHCNRMATLDVTNRKSVFETKGPKQADG